MMERIRHTVAFLVVVLCWFLRDRRRDELEAQDWEDRYQDYLP